MIAGFMYIWGFVLEDEGTGVYLDGINKNGKQDKVLAAFEGVLKAAKEHRITFFLKNTGITKPSAKFLRDIIIKHV